MEINHAEMIAQNTTFLGYAITWDQDVDQFAIMDDEDLFNYAWSVEEAKELIRQWMTMKAAEIF
jgi:hypothetical protein